MRLVYMFPTVCVHNSTPGYLGQLPRAVCDTLVGSFPGHTQYAWAVQGSFPGHTQYAWVVQGSFPGHTQYAWADQVKFKLCHMTQVLLNLSFTAMERLTGYYLHV